MAKIDLTKVTEIELPGGLLEIPEGVDMSSNSDENILASMAKREAEAVAKFAESSKADYEALVKSGIAEEVASRLSGYRKETK